MILTPESAALALALHRRGENGSEVLGNAPATDPLMWATCACGWIGTKQGVIRDSPLTERMLAALTEDWELHVAREPVAGAAVDTEAEGITITVQLHGQTLPNRPFLVAQVRHLHTRLWRNARAADRHSLGMVPGWLRRAVAVRLRRRRLRRVGCRVLLPLLRGLVRQRAGAAAPPVQRPLPHPGRCRAGQAGPPLHPLRPPGGPMTLEPTPDLIAAARRAAGRGWIVGPRGSAEVCTDPTLALLVQAGYVRLHYVSAAAQARGDDDYWGLTGDGRVWLAANDTEEEII